MYAKQPKKLLILNILDILRKYTDEDHRLSQNERFDAWQEIIDTMPDAPLPDNMELKEMEGVHEFLRQYMKLQKEFLDEFNREEGGVYFYRYTIRELPNKSWPWEYITIENFDHAFLIDPSKYESSMVSLIMEMVNQILIEVFSAVAQWETEKRAKRQRGHRSHEEAGRMGTVWKAP